jgi:hypothetical protein
MLQTPEGKAALELESQSLCQPFKEGLIWHQPIDFVL